MTSSESNVCVHILCELCSVRVRAKCKKERAPITGNKPKEYSVCVYHNSAHDDKANYFCAPPEYFDD